jgi:hypothetical protein
MGVNRPSVKDLRPDHGWGNSHHTQPARKGKERSVEEGEGEHARQESWKENGGTLKLQRVMNRGEGE